MFKVIDGGKQRTAASAMIFENDGTVVRLKNLCVLDRQAEQLEMDLYELRSRLNETVQTIVDGITGRLEVWRKFMALLERDLADTDDTITKYIK